MKILIAGMVRAEMVLKVVMSPLDPCSAFVEQYVRLVQDTDVTELAKILDMKGVKRSDQTVYIDMYKEQSERGDTSPAYVNHVSSHISSLPASPAHAQMNPDQSKIAKLEKMIKNRL